MVAIVKAVGGSRGNSLARPGYRKQRRTRALRWGGGCVEVLCIDYDRCVSRIEVRTDVMVDWWCKWTIQETRLSDGEKIEMLLLKITRRRI